MIQGRAPTPIALGEDVPPQCPRSTLRRIQGPGRRFGINQWSVFTFGSLRFAPPAPSLGNGVDFRFSVHAASRIMDTTQRPSPCTVGLPFDRSSVSRLSPGLRLIALALLFGLLGSGAALAQPESRELPAEFVENRIYVTAATSTGDSLRLLTDTGGGRAFVLTRPAMERLGLSVTDTLSRGRRSIPITTAPSFRTDGPVPSTSTERALVAPPRRARLVGYDDGRLGQSWFADRVWTFDYGAEQLLLHESTEALSFAPTHTVDLAFQTDASGQRTSHHPRIEATIADSTHSFLFDTGATTILTDSAQSVLGGSKRRAVSYVTASLFEHWHQEHPEWRVVDRASAYPGHPPLIRVPEVTIAGHSVGPVWFERRPDRVFRQMMAQSMDQPVDGALGGSLFRHFRITVDYPGARAHFQRLD